MGGGDMTATPEQIAAWEAEELPPTESFGDKVRAIRTYFGAGPKSFIFGHYSYRFLCMPSFWPWRKGGNVVRSPCILILTEGCFSQRFP